MSGVWWLVILAIAGLAVVPGIFALVTWDDRRRARRVCQVRRETPLTFDYSRPRGGPTQYDKHGRVTW